MYTHSSQYFLHFITFLLFPGGIICISMREEYLDHVSEYSENLVPLMNKLQEEGQWAALSKDVIENYALGKSGIVFQFRVK